MCGGGRRCAALERAAAAGRADVVRWLVATYGLAPAAAAAAYREAAVGGHAALAAWLAAAAAAAAAAADARPASRPARPAAPPPPPLDADERARALEAVLARGAPADAAWLRAAHGLPAPGAAARDALTLAAAAGNVAVAQWLAATFALRRDDVLWPGDDLSLIHI